MKSKLFILSTLFFLTFQYNTFAQKDFVWNHYKIGISLPDDFEVVQNTDNEFESDGIGMHLYMYIFEDSTISSKDMKSATLKLARDLKFEAKDEFYDVEDDEFEGKYILGYKDGQQIMLAGLVDSKSTNLWVFIIFEDGDHIAEKDGLKILNSIHKIK